MTRMNERSIQPTNAVAMGHFSEALRAFAAQAKGETLSVNDIAQFMQRRTIGALLLIFALPMVIPIPAPGVSVAFGIPLILVSAQLFLGLTQVWLPRRLATRRIEQSSLASLTNRAMPWLSKLERIARPRLTWLVDGKATLVSGAVCATMGVIITLPIPLGHFVPGVAVVLIAIGLIERDGLLLAIGLGISLAALLLVTLASSALMNLVRSWVISF
jgi:hypothetical protein